MTWKLTMFRKKNNLRFNSNLFKIFIQPLYRLAKKLYMKSNKQEKQAFNTHRRVKFKLFTCLPLKCPNRIVYEFINNYNEQTKTYQ